MNIKTNILFLMLLILFSSFKAVNIKQSKRPFIVVIDPGHGGYDSGAIGFDNIKEKNINLDIAIVTKYLLNKYDKNIRVILTRNNDRFIPLKKRAAIAKYFKADLFISLHCDANKNNKARGAGVFIVKNLKNKKYSIINYKKTVKFALILNKILTTQLKLKVRKIEFENFSVLRNTLKDMPSVLLEIGFITNHEEAEYFKNKGKKGISYSLCKAIIKFKNEQ